MSADLMRRVHAAMEAVKQLERRPVPTVAAEDMPARDPMVEAWQKQAAEAQQERELSERLRQHEKTYTIEYSTPSGNYRAVGVRAHDIVQRQLIVSSRRAMNLEPLPSAPPLPVPWYRRAWRRAIHFLRVMQGRELW